jgi:hypothetical protein
VADTYGKGLEGHFESPWKRNYLRPSCSYMDWEAETISFDDGSRRYIESGLVPLVAGFPARMGLCRGYGNAIVPQVAECFLKAYVEARTTESNNLTLILRNL